MGFQLRALMALTFLILLFSHLTVRDSDIEAVNLRPLNHY